MRHTICHQLKFFWIRPRQKRMMASRITEWAQQSRRQRWGWRGFSPPFPEFGCSEKRTEKKLSIYKHQPSPPRIWKHNDGSAMANPCSLFYCQFLLGDNLFRKKARHSWCYSASYHQSVSSKTLSGIFSFICFITYS